MKTNSLSIACFVLLGLMLSCQENKKEEANVVKPRTRTDAGARRACPEGGFNTFLYGFIKPDSDYGYNGDGCQTYYIHRGGTRQIKVRMANLSGATLSLGQLYIVMPYDPSSITYSVASVTGGYTNTYTPYPASGNGSSILWTAYSIPANTTYDLTLNVMGVTAGPAAENGLSLVPTDPCYVTPNTDCDADENLHVVLTN